MDKIPWDAFFRKPTKKEIEAINHKNALKLVSDNPFLSDMTKLLESK